MMSRVLSPEAVMAVFTSVIWVVCLRHPSGQGHDVEVLGKVVLLLPFIAVPLAFATFFGPGQKDWWWLGRAIAATLIALLVCSTRLISGFGTGAKGQDAAFILVFTFGLILTSLGTAATGVMILQGANAAFGRWFEAHRWLGVLAGAAATVPIGLGLAVVLGTVIAMAMGVMAAFE